MGKRILYYVKVRPPEGSILSEQSYYVVAESLNDAKRRVEEETAAKLFEISVRGAELADSEVFSLQDY